MESDFIDDQFQAPVEEKRRFFAFVIIFLFGMFFFALILQIFFNGSLHFAFGQKVYTQEEYMAKEMEVYDTYTQKNEELIKSIESSQAVLEFGIMTYYIKGFADGNKGKGDKYFIQCVKKDNILGTSIMNRGAKYLKPEILSQISNGLLPGNVQGETTQLNTKNPPPAVQLNMRKQ